MNDLSTAPQPEGDRPERQRKPDWIRVKAPVSKGYNETRKLMRDLNLHTVCEEAACPNIGECWTKKHATVMILGDTCTRACRFCNIKTGMPMPVDPLVRYPAGPVLFPRIGPGGVVFMDDTDRPGEREITARSAAVSSICSSRDSASLGITTATPWPPTASSRRCMPILRRTPSATSAAGCCSRRIFSSGDSRGLSS